MSEKGRMICRIKNLLLIAVGEPRASAKLSNEQVVALLEYIEQLEFPHPWVSVKAGLPKVNKDTLFLCRIKNDTKDFVDCRTFWAEAKMFSSEEVTHWMRIPDFHEAAK